MLNASSSGDCSLFLFQAAQLVLHFNQPVVLELVSLRAAEGIFDLSSPVVVAQSCTFFFSKTTEHLLAKHSAFLLAKPPMFNVWNT